MDRLWKYRVAAIRPRLPPRVCLRATLDRGASTHLAPKARAAVTKALEIDNSLADAYASSGLIRTLFEWDFAAAARDFERSIELDANYPLAHDWIGHVRTFCDILPPNGYRISVQASE